MKPILIYTESEAKRNAFAVNKICCLLGAELKTPDYDGDAQYVINRTDDYTVAQRFEARGIRVFNSAAFSRLANDKQLCCDFMEKNGVEIMPTRYKTPPFVKKPRDGHGGQGVVMCLSEAEYDENAVCQMPASDLGRDLRVWVIGGEIITSVLRVSKTDFRANYCLGGEAVPYGLSEAETAEVKKIISLVNGDYYGIDFVFNNGRIVFNELEDAVGARMVYAKTDIDIIGRFCEYVKHQTRPTRKALRLNNYDYSSDGIYFITVCTKDMQMVFSDIVVGETFGLPPEVVLSNYGKATENELKKLNSIYDGVKVIDYVIMPNHIHMLLSIEQQSGRPQVSPTISRVIQQFKGAVTKKIGKPIWQNSFNDHIIRNDEDLLQHLQYIDENPAKWLLRKDEYFC